MPARLDNPPVKVDIRLYAEDKEFLDLYLPTQHTKLTPFVRDLVHSAVIQLKKRMGHPVGEGE